MAGMSNYLENALLNHVLRNVAFTAPTTVYLALYTTDPTDADTGTEVTGGGYARQAITFAVPAGGATTNSAEIAFPVATADWGTISHLGVRDAATAGNLLLHSAFTIAKTIQTGDQFVVRAQDLDISFD